MAGPYSDLTDEELAVEISAYRAAMRGGAMGGEVLEISGEGRRIKYAGSSRTSQLRELNELIAERNRRAGGGGTALGVDFL